jgi:hypothetical protein
MLLQRPMPMMESMEEASSSSDSSAVSTFRTPHKKHVHGVNGMAPGSLDCNHTFWKNCPKSWHGSYKGRKTSLQSYFKQLRTIVYGFGMLRMGIQNVDRHCCCCCCCSYDCLLLPWIPLSTGIGCCSSGRHCWCCCNRSNQNLFSTEVNTRV